jgi:hypothetical protein
MFLSEIVTKNFNSESREPLSQIYVCERYNETLNNVANAAAGLYLSSSFHVSILSFYKMKFKTGTCGHLFTFFAGSSVVH